MFGAHHLYHPISSFGEVLLQMQHTPHLPLSYPPHHPLQFPAKKKAVTILRPVLLGLLSASSDNYLYIYRKFSIGFYEQEALFNLLFYTIIYVSGSTISKRSVN